jgi:hypothetical protein
MISDTRRDLLEALEAISEVDPEFRFGQLVANLSYVALGPTHEAIWDAEDDELLAAALSHLENRRNSRGEAAGVNIQ